MHPQKGITTNFGNEEVVCARYAQAGHARPCCSTCVKGLPAENDF